MESTVLFFNTQKGFGKLQPIASTNSEEIFFHRSVVEAESDLVEGERVSFELDKTDKGFQATRVVRLGRRLKGRVVTFSGFGKIRPDDGTDPVFVHYSDIIGSGFKTLEEEEQVEFEIENCDKRRKAVRVKRLETRPPLERFSVLEKWTEKLAALADPDPVAHKEDWA